MSYELKYETPTVDDYIEIRLAAGLSRKSIEAARVGLSNTLCAVSIYSDGLPIGIGRVIGDGGCFFEIVDIAVKPEHQKNGLGDMIMERQSFTRDLASKPHCLQKNPVCR